MSWIQRHNFALAGREGGYHRLKDFPKFEKIWKEILRLR
jgi:hypothetical protein